MTGWWPGTRLVAGRAIADGAASKSWRVITVLMLLLGTAAVLLPRLLDSGPAQYRLAATPGTPAQIERVLAAAGQSAGFDVAVAQVPDAADAQAAVRDGEADAGLVAAPDSSTGAALLYVSATTAGTFPALVSQAVAAQATEQALADAGLTPEQIAVVQAVPPPQQVVVGRVADEGRAGLGFVVGIVLYLALILTGTTVASAVATEKTTRISEVLLAVLRPTQLLVGTVLGVGLLGLVQVVALGLPVLVGLLVGDGLDLPNAAAVDVVLALGWFVLGLALYAFVFAALATLVEKVSEVGAAVLPANALLIGSYLLAVTVTVVDPNAPLSVAASLFPLSAPMVMPIRWASGLVPPWELALAMALTAAAAVALALVASRIYARGLAMTGRRVKLREVLRRG
jgi:ABC-2 type transport system permease protein